MYLFIPSWYAKERKWCAVEESWYRKRAGREFDDTINQIRMFFSAGEETALLLLSYTTQLRHFLHRQGIDRIPVWSAFDEIQGVSLKEVGILSYRDLKWPERIEWVYTPFVVLGYVDDALYARIEFGEESNFLWIDFFNKKGDQVRTDYYDDRGFRSSARFYVDGKPAYQGYYDTQGNPRMREDLKTGEVIVSNVRNFRFRKERYENMEELLTELLTGYLVSVGPKHTVVVASNIQHNRLVRKAIQGQTTVFSYFENRFDLSQAESLREDVETASFLVADTEYAAKQIREACGDTVPIYDISPFDTRLSLGQSQRLREQKIFLPIDHLPEPYRSTALKQIFQYMEGNEDVQLILGTATGNEEEMDRLRKEMAEILRASDVKSIGIERENVQVYENAEILEEERRKRVPRVFVQRCLTESDLIRLLADVRLIVDVSDQPELYLQIAGISAGIPQVNYRFTRYVEHLKDGYIVQNIYHITEALEYYLNGLKHWNEALVYCVQKVSSYTGGNLVKQWKELSEGNG